MKPIFINTRPQHRADMLNQLTQFEVLSLPLLSIHDVPLDNTAKVQLQQWQNGDYDALVVTSVESAKRALKYLGNSPYPSTPIVAVGEATAQCLQQAGLSVQLPETANNEGMLQLPIIQSLTAGCKLLIWRGIGGRRLLHDTLSAAKVHIDAIPWYERRCPADLSENFLTILPTIKKAGDAFVLISSQAAFENWQTLAHPDSVHYHYLALGDRLHHLLTTTNKNVSQIDTLTPKAISYAILDQLAKQDKITSVSE